MPAATADTEEIREGSESSLSPSSLKRKRHSRKRSAKGASHTAAPMDSECCAEKAGKPKCSACAAGKPCSGAKNDSLTAQDILDAYDLGISDRSPSYIRARLDAMKVKTGGRGKKCGGSYIPANATCHNGQAPAAQQKGSKLRRGLETASALGGLALYSGGAGYAIGSAATGNLRGTFRGLAAANTGGALMGATAISRGKREGDKNLVKAGKRAVASGAAGATLSAALSGDVGAAARGARKAMTGKRAQAAAGAAGRAAGSAYASVRSRMGRPNTVSGQAMGTASPAGYKPTAGQRARRAAHGAAHAAGRAAGSAYGAYKRARRGKAVPYPYGSPLARYGAIRRRDSVWSDGFESELANVDALEMA